MKGHLYCCKSGDGKGDGRVEKRRRKERQPRDRQYRLEANDSRGANKKTDKDENNYAELAERGQKGEESKRIGGKAVVGSGRGKRAAPREETRGCGT